MCRALGRKVSDEFTVPVCRTHHREIHRCGDEASWWRNIGVEPLVAARTLWLATIHFRERKPPLRTTSPLPTRNRARRNTPSVLRLTTAAPHQRDLRLSCSLTPSRIAASISGALFRGNSLCSPRSSTATASISYRVRLVSRQRRRARFASLWTMTTPTNMRAQNSYKLPRRWLVQL